MLAASVLFTIDTFTKIPWIMIEIQERLSIMSAPQN